MFQEEKRLRILDVAIDEFARKGYDAVNINEVSQLAEIGKGTIYLYFSSKESLFLSCLQQVVQFLNEKSQEVMALPVDAAQKLDAAVRGFFSLYELKPGYITLWAHCQVYQDPRFGGETARILKDLRHPFCEIVEEGVREGIFAVEDPIVAGDLCVALLVSLLPGRQKAGAVHFPTLVTPEQVSTFLKWGLKTKN